MTTPPEQTANAAHVQIYWSPMCVWCWKVKWLLNRKGVAYEQIHVWMILGWKPPTPSFREMHQRTGGEYEVPQIFVNGEHVGDDDTLFDLDRAGKLDALLGMAN